MFNFFLLLISDFIASHQSLSPLASFNDRNYHFAIGLPCSFRSSPPLGIHIQHSHPISPPVAGYSSKIFSAGSSHLWTLYLNGPIDDASPLLQASALRCLLYTRSLSNHCQHFLPVPQYYLSSASIIHSQLCQRRSHVLCYRDSVGIDLN